MFAQGMAADPFATRRDVNSVLITRKSAVCGNGCASPGNVFTEQRLWFFSTRKTRGIFTQS